MAELSAREGKLERAESYLQDVMRVAPDDPRTAEELIAVLRAEGKTEQARKLTQEWLGRFPQRYFLLEQVEKPDLRHLGDDAERVLNIAAEYMRLGLYSQALAVLSRNYPPAVADESEPGVLPPQASDGGLLPWVLPRQAGPIRRNGFQRGTRPSTELRFPQPGGRYRGFD